MAEGRWSFNHQALLGQSPNAKSPRQASLFTIKGAFDGASAGLDLRQGRLPVFGTGSTCLHS